jgi:hypothetical protein
MNFSQAPLGIVAYGEVVGADGSSPGMNSGVATARLGTGTYSLTLPTNQAQAANREITIIQLKGASFVPLFHCCDVDDSDPATKMVYIGSSATTAVDADFSFIIFRSLLNPPAGSPA